jgi:tyrosine-protein phosphatase OCA6
MIVNPPFRFSWVEGDVCRGAYPKHRNLLFLEQLGLKTIISLTPEPPIITLDIPVIHYRIEKQKEFLPTIGKIVQILQLIAQAPRPVFVHCVEGTEVTSLVIMCLRKTMGWDLSSIFNESNRFVAEWLPEQIDFVKAFPVQLEIPKPKPKLDRDDEDQVLSRTLQALDLQV